MAKRQTDVVIEPRKGHYKIDTDAGLRDILEAIEGVRKAYPLFEGTYYVYIDPRYIAEEVLAELKQVIKEAMEPEIPSSCSHCSTNPVRKTVAGGLQWIECPCCGARGPRAVTKEEAINSWNDAKK